MKKIAGLTLGILCLLPAATAADTLADLQAQLQSLFAQIATLQSELQPASTAPVAVAPAPLPIESTVCPSIARDLALGARGSDVEQLQRFLIAQKFLAADAATGYFGALTRKALQEWQLKAGVVSSADLRAGWGRVGPRTRAAILTRCSGTDRASQSFATTTESTSGVFTAFPYFGAAPFTAVFSVSVSGSDASTYVVDFGDGSQGVMDRIACVQGVASCGLRAEHTYTRPTDYIARLSRYEPNRTACVGANCPSIAQALILVREGASASAPHITAVNGPNALSAGYLGEWSIEAAVPNATTTPLLYAIRWGDELPASTTFQSSPDFTHTYQRPGTYSAVFIAASASSTSQVTNSIYVGQ